MLCSIVLVFAKHQHESAIDLPMSPQLLMEQFRWAE